MAGIHQPHVTMISGCFITGTDTGVGKTVVTAAVARCLSQRGINIGVMKPIETGCRSDDAPDSDASRLRTAAGVSDALQTIRPYRFAEPLAPLAAARHACISIEIARIAAAFNDLSFDRTVILVEGVGGVRVPITADMDVRDLIVALDLPALVVGRVGIGGINHALLTSESLRQGGITIRGLVLNHCAPWDGRGETFLQNESTVQILQEQSGVRVFGPLRFEPELDRHWESGLARLVSDPVVQALADWVAPTGP